MGVRESGRERKRLPASTKRHGFWSPPRTPMRAVVTTSGAGAPVGRGRTASGGSHTGRPLCARLMPRAWASRAGPEASRRVSSHSAAGDHGVDAVPGLEGAEQHPRRDALLLRGDVGAEVHAVREVDVEVAGRPEEHGVAVGLAAVAVAAGIVLPVRLGLDDAPSGAAEEEGAADEVARDFERVACEERLRQWLGTGHDQSVADAARTPRRRRPSARLRPATPVVPRRTMSLKTPWMTPQATGTTWSPCRRARWRQQQGRAASAARARSSCSRTRAGADPPRERLRASCAAGSWSP